MKVFQLFLTLGVAIFCKNKLKNRKLLPVGILIFLY
jgi:hypothetical protein